MNWNEDSRKDRLKLWGGPTTVKWEALTIVEKRALYRWIFLFYLHLGGYSVFWILIFLIVIVTLVMLVIVDSSFKKQRWVLFCLFSFLSVYSFFLPFSFLWFPLFDRDLLFFPQLKSGCLLYLPLYLSHRSQNPRPQEFRTSALLGTGIMDQKQTLKEMESQAKSTLVSLVLPST